MVVFVLFLINVVKRVKWGIRIFMRMVRDVSIKCNSIIYGILGWFLLWLRNLFVEYCGVDFFIILNMVNIWRE